MGERGGRRAVVGERGGGYPASGLSMRVSSALRGCAGPQVSVDLYFCISDASTLVVLKASLPGALSSQRSALCAPAGQGTRPDVLRCNRGATEVQQMFIIFSDCQCEKGILYIGI